jgi:uncharacterized membrane protein YfcA
MENIVGLVSLFVAAMIAGVINSVAGGGTLISFPTLIAFGISSIQANATNTAALWPGSLSSAFAYSRDMKPDRKMVTMLVLPSAVGGLLGALALVATPPELFSHLVPFLVLFATVLFASRPVMDRLLKRESQEENVTSVGKVWGFLFQLFVATYGGYFGAGIGILMLASMSIMGFRDIHRMNGLKTILGTLINFIAFLFFAWRGLVDWPLAILMTIGAIIGGYLGAHFAKRIDQRVLRAFIIIVGLIVSVYLFFKA